MDPPDTTDKVVSFGCAFIVGALLFGVSLAFLFADTRSEALLAIAFPALVCGIAAVVYGDRFWQSLSKWRWWI